MPFEQMDEQRVASYLQMDLREVRKLSSRGQMPCRKVGGRFVYMKADLDHWIEQQMPELDRKRLADIEKGVSEHHGYDSHERMHLVELVPNGGVAVPLGSRTREATIRALVHLADEAGMVYAKEELTDAIRQREQVCTTALAPGVALPHPRHPLPYDIAQSFVVVGLTSSGIPFGAEDGSLTRLFFLICCKDESTHLHVLARLARMLHDQGDVDTLLACEDADALREKLIGIEKAALGE